MIKPILLYPNKILKQISSPVLTITQETKDLAQDLLDTLAHSKGLGISAPQIGVLHRVIVVMFDIPIVMINPSFGHRDRVTKDLEGCLSFPEIFEKIDRFQTIHGSYEDLDGKTHLFVAEDIIARCIQHEIDHLDGKLFIEGLSGPKRMLINKTLGLI